MIEIRSHKDILVSVDRAPFRSAGYISGINDAMAWADRNAGNASSVVFHRIGLTANHPDRIDIMTAEVGDEMVTLTRR